MALVEPSAFFTFDYSRSWLSITAVRFALMLSAVALLLISFLTRWAQSRVTWRGASVFATSQKFSANLVTRLSGLECKVGFDTAQLEAFISTVARLDRT